MKMGVTFFLEIMSKHFMMTLCEQNIFGRTTCLTLTAKVKVGVAECQDMLEC